jgi:uncharacterized protein with PQ loop repeat
MQQSKSNSHINTIFCIYWHIRFSIYLTSAYIFQFKIRIFLLKKPVYSFFFITNMLKI